VASPNSPVSQRQCLWAKTSAKEDKHSGQKYQPLLFHLLDVAAVASLVWTHCLGGQLRTRLEGSLGVDARTRVVFFAGAHDLGKASPSFQKKVPDLARHTGLSFSQNDQSLPHGFITTRLLRDMPSCSSASSILAQIAGAHHGVFPRSIDLRMGRDTLGDSRWEDAQEELLREFASIVGFDLSAQYEGDIVDPAVVPILAGFISVVDWIGSNQKFFPCVAECGVDVRSNAVGYWDDAQKKAKEALQELGWLPAPMFANEAQFKDVFRGFLPNSLQTAVAELASRQTSPYLMIVEAPMGKGKTEAALYAADLAMCRGFARGMFVAMPTQATSNAMFSRVLNDYLRGRGHRGKLNLQLVHGDAFLAQVPAEGEVCDFKPVSMGDEGDLEAQSWFTAKKRPLLAPFGVGTIDQALLSVLQTKHWFVRLSGLAGKVVIFDEVHAYDAYMSTILERLLRWLAEVDCTVILLSATLPDAKRRALAEAYSGQSSVEYARYPRITLAQPRQYSDAEANFRSGCSEIPMDTPRTIDLLFGKPDLQSLTKILSRRLQNGGCAAVICNTVNRSIEVYKHLRDNLDDTECLLFHARTLQVWRREREEEVLRKFGKCSPQEKDTDDHFMNPDRPFRAVLIATQVIEQSLDLDFDLMISEIAPIDLLLQRLGRLHRHPRGRPSGLEMPQFILLCDAETAGPPPESFGKSESVYDRYVLLRTWQVLRQREKLELPAEIETLVEAVYDESSSADADGWTGALASAKNQMEYGRIESEKTASHLLVAAPKDPFDLIEQFNDQLADDEDPRVHRTVRAATREGDPSITVVMLPATAPLIDELQVHEIQNLLNHAAKLNHRGVFNAMLTEGEQPREWAKNAHLRYARLLRLDENNRGRVSQYILTADGRLGVVIGKDKSDG
jgi:CRISPR-associated endonuclease/helicase Cas3